MMMIEIILKWKNDENDSNNYALINHDIDGLVQEGRNSTANALELRLSCTNPSTCSTRITAW